MENRINEKNSEALTCKPVEETDFVIVKEEGNLYELKKSKDSEDCEMMVYAISDDVFDDIRAIPAMD